jgi:co-chaperonin GroES (HSP10)
MTSQNLSLAKEECGLDPILKAYRILVRAPIIKDKTNGGVILPSEYREETTKKAAVGKILKIGPLSFVGEKAKHYKTEVGKWILYSRMEREPAYSIKEGVVCYYVNDDRIHSELSDEDAQAILDDLRGY